MERSRNTLLALAALLVLTVSAARAQGPVSEETIDFFARNCASCHTIGGGALAGPDLRGAPERREEAWLIDFLLDPKRVVDSGDPVALELVREARGVLMPQIPGIDRALAAKLVDLIRVESALERSRFAGLALSDRPLTAADVERGSRLFQGIERFASGAPACTSCHHASGIGYLGGGRLGPDLSAAYARLDGRKALAAWLSAPPSPVMQPVYRKTPLEGEEVLSLVAFLADRATHGEEAGTSLLRLVVAGALGTALLLVLLDFLWRRRYRATRRPLIELKKRRTLAAPHP